MEISVIIPIYNVEPYIRRCIDSVINQTFKDMEIILVDDGSTDKSGQIADYYQSQDSRIQVIHKINGGLSDARNRGMEQARGKYLFFLDSDDALVKDTLELLYNAINRYEAECVVCGFYYANEEGEWYDSRYWEKGETVKVLDNQEAMCALIQNKYIKNFAWGKLYKRELIQSILFEKGVFFEDIVWQAEVFSKLKRCVVLKQVGCYYYQREDSIIGHLNMKKLDMIDALKRRHDYIKQHYPSLQKESWYSLLQACFNYYILLLKEKTREARYHRKQIRAFMRRHYRDLLQCSSQDEELRLYLRLFHLHPILFIVGKLAYKVARKFNILKQEKVLIRVQDEYNIKVRVAGGQSNET